MSDRLPSPRPLTEPNPDRVAPGDPNRPAIVAAHTAAMRQGSAGYADPVSGLFVFTASHLLAKGRCCDSGCRHCPFI